MNNSIIVEGRRFITGQEITHKGEICASCGLPRATEKKTKALNSTFNQTEFFLFDSQYICQKCLDVFSSKDSRTKCLLWLSTASKRIIQREDVLPFLQDIPNTPFVLSVPYSFQKHHWFQAGLSHNGKAYVGTEQGCVELDYTAHDFISIISLVLHMLEVGVPRKELEIGAYSAFTLSKFGGWIDEQELKLAPFRAGGAIRLFVTYAPARKTKSEFSEEIKRMYSENEQIAIAILCDLAKASKYRQNDGLKFWQGYFKARIVRYMYEDINTFFSNVAKDTSADTIQLATDTISKLDANTGNAVMDEIKSKTDLLVAAAFSQLKEQREIIKEKNETKVKQDKQTTKKKAVNQNANTLL